MKKCAHMFCFFYKKVKFNKATQCSQSARTGLDCFYQAVILSLALSIEKIKIIFTTKAVLYNRI